MASSGYSHGGKAKWIVAIIAFLIIGAILCGLMTNWYSDFNPFCWFGHDYQNDICSRCGTEYLHEIQTANGGLLGTVANQNYGMRLAAKRSARTSDNTSESTWTLTATVNEEATDKKVDWTLEWAEGAPTGIGSNGQPDFMVTQERSYLSVEPSMDGSLTATVTCLKPFSKPINVVVTSRSNPEKSAVCKFDYIKKVTGITVNMPNIANTTVAFSYVVEMTEGTVTPTVAVSIDSEMWLSAEFVDTYFTELSFMGARADNTFMRYATLSLNGSNIKMFASQDLSEIYDWTATRVPNIEDHTVQDHGNFYSAAHPLAACFCAYSKSNISELEGGRAALTNAFREAVLSVSGAHAYFMLSATATLGNDYSASFNKRVEVRFDGSSLTMPVTDISLDNSHIYA